MRTFRSMLTAVAGFALLTLAPITTQAQYTQPKYGELYIGHGLYTNRIPTIGVTNPAGSSLIENVPGSIFVIWPSISATQASTSNFMAKVRTSDDGRHWNTTWLTNTATLTGTTTNYGPLIMGTNILAKWLSIDGFATPELGSVFCDRIGWGFFPLTSTQFLQGQ